MSVTATLEPLVIPTFPVGTPEKNPLFFEKRVYQGSNGKVYPVPFIDKVYDHAIDTIYRSARLENDLVRLVMLPEIGGRIFIGQDKLNANYDFFYRQDVIKPALVGLAGPWISGGVEFNWPQHHRPGTFMPADVSIEEEADGARTIWFSEHDPIHRLKGMHGIRLRPGSSLIELRGRLYNRTAMTRTFLWWANVAAMVHDRYQSFFPEDVHYVADHAVRASSSFPLAENSYYGVDYQNRPGANDLGWYKNIPVPTSYMVCQTRFDFFGGYDFDADGGFVHVADRGIAPGKKQWTWGNHEFGWAWDRELTNHNGPYVELMAGVFTDNQPDFTYLQPYETKTFSQFWWPIKGLGPVQNANTRAAVRLEVGKEDRSIDFGIAVPQAIPGARVLLRNGEKVLLDQVVDLEPGSAWKIAGLTFEGDQKSALSFVLSDAEGEEILAYRPVERATLNRDRQVATEPPAPEDITSADELYFTGEHLEQYRHPTRDPELYWDEALRRDPGDARVRTALGRRALDRGEPEAALKHLKLAVSRLTSRHPNPVTGEAHYFLGLCLTRLGGIGAARDAFAKATWSYAWRSAAAYQQAVLDCKAQRWLQALVRLEESLDTNRQNNKARTLKARILKELGRDEEAATELAALLAVDPLDHWARWENEEKALFAEQTRNDGQTILDLAFDLREAGFLAGAIEILDWHHQHAVEPVAVPNPLERSPMTWYLLASLTAESGKDFSAALEQARCQTPDRFFPSRIEEAAVLEWALAQPGKDGVAAYALGNFYYDRRRHEDAIRVWERSRQDHPSLATVHRNLGIAYWNARRDGKAATASYEAALAADVTDARIVSEFDQLRKKLNAPLPGRLAFLEQHGKQASERDDATVELASLYNLTGQPQAALDLITSRRFHPWEGGEGSVLRQYTQARLLLGQAALAGGNAPIALEHFEMAMETPESLGEAYHLHQAKADVNYWKGRALRQLGRNQEADAHFQASAAEAGDFSEMAVIEHSPLSWFRGQSLRELGREAEANEVFKGMKDFATSKLQQRAKIDYFATSLPNLLVFDEDLQERRDAENHLMIALACHGLGDFKLANSHLARTLEFTNADFRAAELARILETHSALQSV